MRSTLNGALLAIAATLAMASPAPSTMEADWTLNNNGGIDSKMILNHNPTWEVQAFVDGPVFNLTGPVEKVYAELVKINPNFEEDFKVNEPKPVKPAPAKRQNDLIKCWTGSQADFLDIIHGIDQLSKLPGRPTLSGGGYCDRVSCKNKNAIYWCNYNKDTFRLPSYNNTAEGADEIMRGCNCHGKDGEGTPLCGLSPFSGELHHNYDNWDVLVFKDPKDC